MDDSDLDYATIISDPLLKLTTFERACAAAWPSYKNELELTRHMFACEFADLADCPSKKKRDAFLFDAQRRVRWALRTVAARIGERYPELQDATAEFRREVLSGVRNSRQSGRTPQTFTGAKPYGALDDEALAETRTAQEFTAARRDSRNYREVTVRATVTAELPAPSPAEQLQHLARYFAAQVELGQAA